MLSIEKVDTMHNMELNYLKVFYEVAKAGSFTVAAKRMNISQSALSRAVALLEDRENVKLFERSKAGVTLTSTGNEVFRHCEQLFQTVNRIAEICGGNREVAEGTLKFATTDHTLNYLLARPLANFRREFPLVIPSATIGSPDEIIDSLVNSENEFGLLFAKINYPHIMYEDLRAEVMSVVVETALWRQYKSLDKVLDEVGYISSIGAHTNARPSRVLKELFGRLPRIAFEANSQEAQKSFCLQGGGVAYLQRFMVENEIRDGRLQEVDVGSPHSFKFWLARKKGHELSLPAKLFIDRLRSAY